MLDKYLHAGVSVIRPHLLGFLAFLVAFNRPIVYGIKLLLSTEGLGMKVLPQSAQESSFHSRPPQGYHLPLKVNY